MSLQVPSYPNPFSATPLAGAYAWIDHLALDFAASTGRLRVRVNTSAADAGAGLPGIDSFGVSLGDTLVPASGTTPAVTFPTWAELMADADFAAAFATIRTKLYTHLLSVPALAGSTQVA